jgi:hypothetical protein
MSGVTAEHCSSVGTAPCFESAGQNTAARIVIRAYQISLCTKTKIALIATILS